MNITDQEAIQHLEQSDRYRVLQRLYRPEYYCAGAPDTLRVGIVLDTETTGLDVTKDRIIELGFVVFEYDAVSGKIYRIFHSYAGFEDPGEPLDAVVKEVTGIDDAMLAGQKMDDDEINLWLGRAHLIIAHNAQFDRQMCERRFPICCTLPWACTIQDVAWGDEGIGSAKLDYIAYKMGFFFDGHRAVNDAEATLELLTKTLPKSGGLVFAKMLANARKRWCRLFAVAAPFEQKDALKARGSSWLPDYPYRDQYDNEKRGVWSLVVEGDAADDERQWLTDLVYASSRPRFVSKDITAVDRYSIREFGAEE
ncbi:MAG: 3'-5' exonuclease [Mariprofundales bacterium]